MEIYEVNVNFVDEEWEKRTKSMYSNTLKQDIIQVYQRTLRNMLYPVRVLVQVQCTTLLSILSKPALA